MNLLQDLVNWFIMFDWLTVLSIIIGPVGVIIGIIINEKFRQKEKKLIFSEKYLSRKVEINEQLYHFLREAQNDWADIIKNKNPTNKNDINDLYSYIVLKIANFIDENNLYVNNIISSHIMFILAEFMDYPEMSEKDKKAYIAETNLSWHKIFNAIREDLGFDRIDKELKDLSPIEGELKSMEEYINETKALKQRHFSKKILK